jgi:hypothetical protein
MKRDGALWLRLILLMAAAALSSCSEGTAAPATRTSAPETTQVAGTTPRAEMHATDPTTVELAAGKSTLVEFFAFW